MISNYIIKKRLLGGYGTKAGAKKRLANQKKKCKESKNTYIKADNIYIKGENIYYGNKKIGNIEENPEELEPNIPLAPVFEGHNIPIAPVFEGPKVMVDKVLKDGVNNISLSNVIKLNKKLSEGKKLNNSDKKELGLDLHEQLLNEIKKGPNLKKVGERKLKEIKKEKTLHEQLLDELKKGPNLKKVGERKLKEIKKEKTLHEQLLDELKGKVPIVGEGLWKKKGLFCFYKLINGKPVKVCINPASFKSFDPKKRGAKVGKIIKERKRGRPKKKKEIIKVLIKERKRGRPKKKKETLEVEEIIKGIIKERKRGRPKKKKETLEAEEIIKGIIKERKRGRPKKKVTFKEEIIKPKKKVRTKKKKETLEEFVDRITKNIKDDEDIVLSQEDIEIPTVIEEGAGYGGYFYNDNRSKIKDLLNERNKYGFHPWFK